MKTHDKCGIYLICCEATGKQYVGSSCRIYQRWVSHRYSLRKAKSSCVILQNAWSFYGESAFVFSILEECGRDVLEQREQSYVDSLKPALNAITDIRRRRGKEQQEKITAACKARAAARTHCPKGHEYTPENIYLGKRAGDKRCKACNRERVYAIYASETPEQAAARQEKQRKYHEANRATRLAKQREYTARTKEQKKLYDIAYRPIKNAKRRKLKI